MASEGNNLQAGCVHVTIHVIKKLLFSHKPIR